ncbi:MAG: FHA domain-containing protein, partial [Myxococcota bacterium]
MEEPSGTHALSSHARSRDPAVRSFRLEVVEGPQTGASWTASGSVCAIGSHPSSALVIDDPTVSRFHCEIRVQSGGARIRDTESLNGTLVDGVRVIEAFLRTGSLIRLGASVVRFEYGDEVNYLPISERERFGALVGASTAMRTAFALMEKAAVRTVTVLLDGETGTGKSAAARAIHEASERRDKPLIIVDCASMPGNLLDSELFGHEKGSFTGADDRRIGAFEAADGGTVFLDEIGE